MCLLSRTTLEMLGLSMLTYQHMNGDMMGKKLKIGRLLWENPAEGEIGRTSAASLIRQVMQSVEFIRNAAELK